MESEFLIILAVGFFIFIFIAKKILKLVFIVLFIAAIIGFLFYQGFLG